MITIRLYSMGETEEWLIMSNFQLIDRGRKTLKAVFSMQNARQQFTFTISMFCQQIQSALSKSRVSAYFTHAGALCH